MMRSGLSTDHSKALYLRLPSVRETKVGRDESIVAPKGSRAFSSPNTDCKVESLNQDMVKADRGHKHGIILS